MCKRLLTDYQLKAYANITATGSNYNTTLVLVLTNSTTVPAGGYGLYVPDLGSLHGATASVQAQKDSQDFGFEVEGGRKAMLSRFTHSMRRASRLHQLLLRHLGNVILHEMTSASQSWYACTDSLVNGTQSVFLKWGVSQ